MCGPKNSAMMNAKLYRPFRFAYVNQNKCISLDLADKHFKIEYTVKSDVKNAKFMLYQNNA